MKAMRSPSDQRILSVVVRNDGLSEFSRLVLLRAFSAQGQSKGVAIETFYLGALPLTAAVTLASIGIRLHVDDVWKGDSQ